jgi:enterochelin esterase-like enzyme
MHDGQNVFDPSTSFLGYDWRVDEVTDSLIRAGSLREIIVVGICNTPDRRMEYSDTEAGRAYARFVVNRVKPLIDSAYRTMPDAEHTAVMGSSMGGLISFLFAWWYPGVFSGAGCLSSVFTGHYTHVLDTVSRYNGPRKPIRIYMDCGGAGGDETLRPGMESMAELLRKGGYREGRDYMVFFDSGAQHNELAWAARVWRPLRFFFP